MYCDALKLVTLTNCSDALLPGVVTLLLRVTERMLLLLSRVTAVTVVPSGMPAPITVMPVAMLEGASVEKAVLVTVLPVYCALATDLMADASTVTGWPKVTSLPEIEPMLVLPLVPATDTALPAFSNGLLPLRVTPVTCSVPLLLVTVGVTWNAVTEATLAVLSDSSRVALLTVMSGVLPPSPPFTVSCAKVTWVSCSDAFELTKNTPPRPAPPPLPAPPSV